jgi:hypothetical protein
MRILLLPLTRRQTLLFGQRLAENEANKPSPLAVWVMSRAQKTWADWGKSKTKWKSNIVILGNRLLDKIDWEEYALKTISDPKTDTTEKVHSLQSGVVLADRRFRLCIQGGLEARKLVKLLRIL